MAADQATRRHQSFTCRGSRVGRNEQRDEPTAFGDFNRLSSFYLFEIATGVLTKFPDPNAFHSDHCSIRCATYRCGSPIVMVPENERCLMQLDLTAEQEELKDQLRSYFVRLVDEVEGTGDGKGATPANDGSPYKRYIRRMGQDGWLGLGWPVEYGGQARGPIDQMIFVEESHWAGVPLPLLTLNSVGPTLMALGTQEQKDRILPASSAARCISPSATPSRRPAPTWHRSPPGRCGTATST